MHSLEIASAHMKGALDWARLSGSIQLGKTMDINNQGQVIKDKEA